MQRTGNRTSSARTALTSRSRVVTLVGAIALLIVAARLGDGAFRAIALFVSGALCILTLRGWGHDSTERSPEVEAELAAAREAQRLAEDRYRILTDNLAAAVVVQGHEGDFLYCSPYMEVLTGYSLREIYAADGDFFESIIDPADLESYRRARRVTAEGEPFQYRVRMRHRTGIVMWIESRSVPIIGSQDDSSSSLSIHFDVTTSVRYQRQVEEKNRELQDLTHIVSHDLKSPLFTLKGMLAMVEEEGGAALTPIREPLQHMNRAVYRLEQLIVDVLEYSRISARATTEEPVPLSTVIEEVQRDFQPLLSEKNATVSIAPDLPTVIADQISLVQIFTNLLSNALKYHSTERLPVISISAEADPLARRCSVRVSDNGRGIPLDKLEMVFAPFQRFHTGDVEGTGMGLTSVKKLVEKLGGEVHVESDGSTGTTFVLTFRTPTE